MGIETDRDVVILHGPNGDVTGDKLIGMSREEVYREVQRTFPEMKERVLLDVLPFLLGNARRVQELLHKPRTIMELGHGERVIALGRGFSGLARANFALIINTHDPNLDDAVVTQAEIIEENLLRTMRGDDATLFTCMTYSSSEEGRSYRQAKATAWGLHHFAREHIRARRPRLWHGGRLHHLVGVVNDETKELEVLEDSLVRTR